MSSALPPVTDCGCSSVSSSGGGGTTTGCCEISGVGNPNDVGVIPPDPTIPWFTYKQLADLISGPVIQIWYWNVNLSVWQ